MLLPYDCVLKVAASILDTFSDASFSDLTSWLSSQGIPVAATPFFNKLARAVHMKKFKAVIRLLPQRALHVMVPELSQRLHSAMEERRIPVEAAIEVEVIQWCLEDHGYTNLSQQLGHCRAAIKGRTYFPRDTSRLPENARGEILWWPSWPGIYVYSFTLHPDGESFIHGCDDVESLQYWHNRKLG
jgi:hypothetical protein